MHPRRETQVMHFIARFNSSVRLFNQTSLPALVLNVGGCDPFRAERRERTGMKSISSAESDLVLSALRTLSARRYVEEGDRQNVPDNVGYNTYFSGHLSGFAPQRKGRSPVEEKSRAYFISASRNNMSPIAIEPLIPVCLYSGNHCAMPQSEIPHSI